MRYDTRYVAISIQMEKCAERKEIIVLYRCEQEVQAVFFFISGQGPHLVRIIGHSSDQCGTKILPSSRRFGWSTPVTSLRKESIPKTS